MAHFQEAESGDWNQERLAGEGGEAVEVVYESCRKRWIRPEMPEDLGVIPRGLASGTDAPGCNGILQVGDLRQGIAEKTDVQGVLGGLDEAVQGRIDGDVITVLCASVLWCRVGYFARGDDCLRQVVVDVGTDAGQSELKTGDRNLAPTLEHGLPAAGG